MYKKYLIEDSKLEVSFLRELLNIINTSKNKFEALEDANNLIKHYNKEYNLSMKTIMKLIDGLEEMIK